MAVKTATDKILELLKLQELDVRMSALIVEAEKIPLMFESVTKRQMEIEETKKKIETDMKMLSLKINQKEKDIEGLNEKIKKLDAQMNTASTNREYQAFQHEINSIKVDIGKIEDEELVFFADQEKKDAELAGLAEKEAELQKDASAVKLDMDVKLKELQAEINELKSEREMMTKQLDYDFVNTYEKIREHKNDSIAIAKADADSCLECSMNITPQEYNNLRKDKEIMFCRSCSRILLLWEDKEI